MNVSIKDIPRIAELSRRRDALLAAIALGKDNIVNDAWFTPTRAFGFYIDTDIDIDIKGVLIEESQTAHERAKGEIWRRLLLRLWDTNRELRGLGVSVPYGTPLTGCDSLDDYPDNTSDGCGSLDDDYPDNTSDGC